MSDPGDAGDLAEWLEALDGPAAVLAESGAVISANAAFQALPDARRAEAAAGGAEDWRAAPLSRRRRLVTAIDPRVARRGRMLATLSHEIRTPLNGVLGMAGLLAATELDATQRAYLESLRDSGEHLLGLVNDVLDYARLDAGRLELELAPTDPERLLQGVCELLSPRAHAGGVEIAWTVEGAVPTVMADDGRLRQILFNLAGNAVKLTAQGGVLLRVAASPAGSGRTRLRFTVEDTGPGLPVEAQARIFEEFEQTEEGLRAGGAGLGLAIVRRLVSALDGALGVESRPGEGAAFWFEASFELAPAPAGRRAPRERPLAGLSVGVVSPSSIVRAAAAGQVAACGGTVETAADLAALASGACDALLIDAAGAAPPPPPVGAPAVVLLAPEARDRIAEARAQGYAGYLIKPLRRASLAERVRAALRAAEDHAGSRPGRARAAETEDERASAAAAAGARVLLVEDNPVNALLARSLLAREGCAVDRAASGAEALEAAARAPYDLILMDLRMPGMDGLATTTALRAQGVRTPVVALTANAFAEDRRACLDVGMDDFLTKPLDPSALRGVLARWSARPPAA